MKDFLKVITSKRFLKHLGLIVGLVVLIYLGIFKFLDIITLHNRYILMPDYSGMTLEQIDSLPGSEVLEFVVIDSIYDKTKPGGSVFMQDPLPHSKAKKGRKVYVTVVASTQEQISMPDLLDLSVRQAVTLLETYGLKAGRIIPKESRFVNAVLAQMYQGDTIHPDTLISRGASIDLIIGKGSKNIPVPFVIGMKEKEAITTIQMTSLNIGKVIHYDDKDQDHSRVYKQEPDFKPGNTLKSGERVSIWLRSDEFFDFQSLIDSYKPDTVAADTTGNIELIEEI